MSSNKSDFGELCDTLRTLIDKSTTELSADQSTLVTSLALSLVTGNESEFEASSHQAGASFLSLGGTYNDQKSRDIRRVWSDGHHDEALEMAKAKIVLRRTGPPSEVAIKIADVLNLAFQSLSASGAESSASHGALRLSVAANSLTKAGTTTVVTVRYQPSMANAPSAKNVCVVSNGKVVGWKDGLTLPPSGSKAFVLSRPSDDQLVVTVTSDNAGMHQVSFNAIVPPPKPAPVPKKEAKIVQQPPKLAVKLVTTFDKMMWDDRGSGGKEDISIWRVKPGMTWYSVGDMFHGGYKKPTKGAMVVKPIHNGTNPDGKPGLPLLAEPLGFTRVWTDRGSGAKKDGALWRPIAPAGYTALGHFASAGYEAPSVRAACVRSDLVMHVDAFRVWCDRGSGARQDGSVWACSDSYFVSASQHNNKPEIWRLKDEYVKRQ